MDLKSRAPAVPSKTMTSAINQINHIQEPFQVCLQFNAAAPPGQFGSGRKEGLGAQLF